MTAEVMRFYKKWVAMGARRVITQRPRPGRHGKPVGAYKVDSWVNTGLRVKVYDDRGCTPIIVIGPGEVLKRIASEATL